MLPCSMKSFEGSDDFAASPNAASATLLRFTDKFVKENMKATKVTCLSLQDREELVREIIAFVKDPNLDDDTLSTQLMALLILSRDAENIEFLGKASVLEYLQAFCGLDFNTTEPELFKSQSVVVALKTMANLIYQSGAIQKFYDVSGLGECALASLQEHSAHARVDAKDVMFYEARILFLLTSLCPDVRVRLRHRINAVKVLHNILAGTLRRVQYQSTPSVVDQDDFRNEVLKVLFNVTIDVKSTEDAAEEEDIQDLRNLTNTLNKLVCSTERPSSELMSNVTNLLVNIPPQCYGILHDDWPPYRSKEGEGLHIPILLTRIVEHLHTMLLKNEATPKRLAETCAPALQLLIMFSTKDRVLRGMLKILILPPLKEEELRKHPTDGTSRRNVLVRMMTNAESQIQILSAVLLFSICNQNVNKLVKYTGYGNAAGLLASLGLLYPTSRPHGSSTTPDTEDEFYKFCVNPVTGRIDSPTKLEDTRTEEQKEHEAVELANVIDKLQRRGIISPAKMGSDGRPVPLEHVLQLQEETQRASKGKGDSNK